MNIIRGKMQSAKKVVIYGPEGIGKSTFAAQFPNPLFIDTEGSTKDMDVARFEKPTSWQMLMDQLRYVKNNPTICKTLIVDTADWAEQMCVEDLCARNNKKGIEDFGYGNGYVYAKEEFGRFLNFLEDIVGLGIHVVLTAHAQIRKFEQPDELGAYDRYELKLGKKTSSQTSPLVKEWADMLLFCNYKTLSVAIDDKGTKHKAQGGRRVMYTSHHPCWDAKNRYGLPKELPLEYDAIRHIIEPNTVESANVPNDTYTPAITRPMVSEPEATPEKTPEKTPAVRAEDCKQMSFTEGKPPETKPKKDPYEPDPSLPKPLKDLMKNNKVDEWDIQNVVSARGYFPSDMPIRDYPEDFIMGVLVGAWEQVYAMIKQAREEQEIPF